MIGVRYVNELFAIKSIPREFWRLIREDLRFDGNFQKIEGFLVLLFLPVLFSSLISIYGVTLPQQFYSLLIAISTLFVGFSMNSVLLLLKYSNKENSSALLVDQTRNLISYLLYLGVLLAFIGIIGYVAASLIQGQKSAPELLQTLNLIISSISIFLLSHFLIVVLFLPARIFTIIEQSTDNGFFS